jgi:hypothetical protein
MTDDPGLNFGARQHDQLVVINNLRRLIDEQHDRFTGLTTDGSSHVVVYLVDPTAAEQDRFLSLLHDARRENVVVELVPGLRSLRELNQIMNDIGRGDTFTEDAVSPVSCGIDVATATVQVTVAARSVTAARRACARYDGAVVITAVDRSAFTTLPTHRGSREGWPVPTVRPETTIGQPVPGVADRYRAEGFTVEIVDPDVHGGVDLDLRTDRIRLLVHDGVVVDAAQG